MKIIYRVKRQWGKLDQSWRFAITAFLIARIFYAVWSWIILTIQPVAIHYIQVDNKPGTIFLSLQTSQAYGYICEVNGEKLSFRSTSKDTVTDLQTNSVWDIYTGTALEGYYQGVVLSPTAVPSDMFPYHGEMPYPNAWLALWQRFDANWYTPLATNGYGSIPGDDHYPPLYPLLVRLTTPIFGNAFIAGLIISHLATLVAIKLLFDLYNQWDNESYGRQTLFYFLIYPTSFYLFSAYTESLFLMTTLLALRFMKKQVWGWAGFWVFCSVSTRLQGVALFIPMICLMWKEGNFLQKISHWVGLIFGGSAFLFYLFLRSTRVSGSAIPFSEPAWHAQLVFPWQTYFYAAQTLLSGKSNYIDFINWFVTTLFIIILIIGWRKIPIEYNLYSAFSLLIMLSRIVETQPLISMSRYSLTLFPIFFVIGLVDKNPWGRRLVIYSFIALNLYLSQEFFGWGWVA